MSDPETHEVVRCAEFVRLADRWTLAMETDIDEANRLFALMREHIETCKDCEEV